MTSAAGEMNSQPGYWAYTPNHRVASTLGNLHLDDVHRQGDFARVDTPSPQLLVGRRGPQPDVLFPARKLGAFDEVVVDDEDGIQVLGPRLENVARERGEVGQDTSVHKAQR